MTEHFGCRGSKNTATCGYLYFNILNLNLAAMYQCSIAIFLAYCFVYQPRLCLGDEKDSTTAKQILAPDNAERLTRLFDPLSREYRIEVAKKEILRKLGMTKRPPKMENLRANIPKPVFDGEISSLFANEDDEPTKTTQVVIPAEEGLSFKYLF